MKRSTALGLLLSGLLVLGGVPASADPEPAQPAISFESLQGWGQLTVQAPAGSEFIVFQEMPDCSYLVTWCGLVGEGGTASAWLSDVAPVGDGLPQVVVAFPGQSIPSLVIDDPAEKWFWE